MEHVPMRGNSSSPHPTENLVTPLIEGDPSLLAQNGGEINAECPSWPSLPPSTTNFQSGDKSQYSRAEPPRSKPLVRGFERPSFSRIVVLVVLCIVAYPAFYILTLVAKDKSLSIVRLIVSAWCSVVGFALGYVLLKIGAQHLEAATWATVIHMSYKGSGMKLRDLARGSQNPTSFMPALHILRSRFGNRETDRRSRKPIDKRPWSLFICFFVILAILGPMLPFIFGRIILIEIFVRDQHDAYHEVLIAGDLSSQDLDRANEIVAMNWDSVENLYVLPYGRSASDTADFPHGNDTVYFAQPTPSQFVPGGSGVGTFDQPVPLGPQETLKINLALPGRNTPKSDTSAVLRYPQWGIRIHCAKLPNPEVNLVPLSQNFTYVFVPQNFLRSLYGTYGVDLPTKFMEPSWTPAAGTVPSNIDLSTISYILESPYNDEGITLLSELDDDGAVTGNQGWTSVETVLVRFDTRYTPSGRFPVYFNYTWHGESDYPSVGESNYTSRMGYDAVVCVQKYEPWVVETYNTSIGSVSALRIVGGGNDSTSSPNGAIRGSPIADTTRYLNTTRKELAFSVARKISINQLTKLTTGRGEPYVPSPTAVSFTEGTGPGPEEYIELSPERFAAIRARAEAGNALPYLVGSGLVVAQSYGDETLAGANYNQWQLIGPLLLILFLGVIGELFVPALPLNVPRREFGVYSWLTLFQSQELRFEATDDLEKLMTLDNLEERFSGKRVKFSLYVERDDDIPDDV